MATLHRIGHLLVAVLIAGRPAAAQDAGECWYRDCPSRTEIAVVNAGLTGVLALARGAASGRVRSWTDAARIAGVGAAGGLGFALAKREAGAGRLLAGLSLVYGTASVVENVAEGAHPLARIRVGVGPVDVRVRTPLARHAVPVLAVEVDPLGVASLVVLPAAGLRPSLAGGVLTWRDTDTSTGAVLGVAVGQVVVLDSADPVVRHHEIVHTFQSRQVGAVAPFGTAGSLIPALRRTSLDGRVSWNLRSGVPTGVLGGLILAAQPYDQRYFEREAYALERP